MLYAGRNAVLDIRIAQLGGNAFLNAFQKLLLLLALLIQAVDDLVIPNRVKAFQ